MKNSPSRGFPALPAGCNSGGWLVWFQARDTRWTRRTKTQRGGWHLLLAYWPLTGSNKHLPNHNLLLTHRWNQPPTERSLQDANSHKTCEDAKKSGEMTTTFSYVSGLIVTQHSKIQWITSRSYFNSQKHKKKRKFIRPESMLLTSQVHAYCTKKQVLNTLNNKEAFIQCWYFRYCQKMVHIKCTR